MYNFFSSQLQTICCSLEKYKFLYIAFTLLFCLIGCDPFENENLPNSSQNNNQDQEEIIPEETEYYKDDDTGNIFILNRLEESIFLYFNGNLLKVIKSNSNLVVNIDNQSGYSSILKIWKESDIIDYKFPPKDLLYRQWEVVLPQNVNASDRATWLIEDSTNETDVGTISFNYPKKGFDGLDVIYSVDIFLQHKEGAKITAVSPGTNNKKVGIEYNYYVIYFLFWYSNPNSATDRIDIGWIEEDLNGDIYETIVNYSSPISTIEVPIFYYSSVGRTGKITITNNTNNFLQIFANGQLIETLISSQLPTSGLSILSSDGGSFTFPLREDDYNFIAKTVKNNERVDSCNFSIIEKYNSEWIISGTNTYNSVEIVNNSNEIITLHDSYSSRYIGHKFINNQVKQVQLLEDITEIKVMNYFGDKYCIIPISSDSIIINDF